MRRTIPFFLLGWCLCISQYQASSQALYTLDAIRSGDSVHVTAQQYCSNKLIELGPGHVDLLDAGDVVPECRTQFFEDSYLPMSVVVLINQSQDIGPDTLEKQFQQIVEFARTVEIPFISFRVVGLKNGLPVTVSYHGDESSFLTELRNTITLENGKFSDLLGMAFSLLYNDPAVYKYVLVLQDKFIMQNMDWVPQYRELGKRYSIDMQFAEAENNAIATTFFRWLARLYDGTVSKVSSAGSLAEWMIQVTQGMNRKNLNLISYKNTTPGDGKEHIVNVTTSYCGSMPGTPLSYVAPDTTWHNYRSARMKIDVLPIIPGHEYRTGIELVNLYTITDHLEPVFVYVELNSKKASFKDVFSNTSTILNSGNGIAGWDDDEAVIGLNDKESSLLTLLAYLRLNMKQEYTTSDSLFISFYVFSGTGRHRWSTNTMMSSNLYLYAHPSNIVCEGTDVTVHAPQSMGPYLWSTGDTTRSITVRSSRTVFCVITDTSGLQRATESLAITVIPTPHPLLNVLNDTTVCKGTFRLEAPSGYQTYQWNTGDTSQGFLLQKTGMYWVDVIDTTGCTGRSDTIQIQVYNMPDRKVTVSPSNIFYEGQTVELSVPELLGGAFQWSNGATDRSITVGVPGKYYVRITNQYGCVCYSDTVELIQRPSINLHLIGPESTCNQSVQTYRIEPENTELTYTWSVTNGVIVDGQGTAEAKVYWIDTTQGVVRVLVNSDVNIGQWEKTVSLRSFEIPEVAPGGTVHLCEGDSAVLSTKNPYAEYLWSTGETTRSITVHSEGLYTVTITDTSGCTGTSDPAVVSMHTAPVAPVITTGTTELSTGIYAQYQWYRNDTALVHETKSTVQLTANGVYTVRVWSAYGCSAISAPVTIQTVAVDALPQASESIALYPDPNRGVFVLHAEFHTPSAVSIAVTDILGRCVYSSISSDKKTVFRETVTLRDCLPGMYFVLIHTDAISYVRKVIVQE